MFILFIVLLSIFVYFATGLPVIRYNFTHIEIGQDKFTAGFSLIVFWPIWPLVGIYCLGKFGTPKLYHLIFRSRTPKKYSLVKLVTDKHWSELE